MKGLLANSAGAEEFGHKTIGLYVVASVKLVPPLRVQQMRKWYAACIFLPPFSTTPCFWDALTEGVGRSFYYGNELGGAYYVTPCSVHAPRLSKYAASQIPAAGEVKTDPARMCFSISGPL